MDLQKYRQNPVPMGEKNYLKPESDALVWLWSDWTEKLYKYIQRRKSYWMYWLIIYKHSISPVHFIL